MEMSAIKPEKDSVKNEKQNENNDNKPEDKATGEILKPGSKIRPEATIEQVEKLSQRLYGITASSIKELISYDDRNYLIHEDRNVKNPLITNNCPHGYVMKILNAFDSKKTDFVDGQTELMIFLRKHNFHCPTPVKNVYGKYYSVESLYGVQHIVRLLEFLPGKIFHEIKPTSHIFYQAGEYVAKLDRTLKNFRHDAYKSHKTLWMLESVPKLKDFIYVIKDPARKEMVEQIIEAFETKVLPKMDTFEKGMIHGDFNEQNIIVDKHKQRDEYQIVGVIDFGDTCYSLLVFELAICMTYMMLQSKDLETGGLVLAGYNSVRLVPEKEKEILMNCVAARLCQSVVLGAYTFSLDPDNEYLLTTQKAGWELLESIWSENADKANEIWNAAADEYVKQSVK